MHILSTSLLTLSLLLPTAAWAADVDADGYDEAWDCDDQDPLVNPGALDDPLTLHDEDCDGTSGPGVDSDGDGLHDALEGAIGTDPNLADSDGDTLQDGQEVDLGADALVDFDGDGLIDAMDADDDEDGIPTALEATQPNDDLDGDAHPNWHDLDDDGDGIPSGVAGPGGWDGINNFDGDALLDFADPDDDGDGVPTLLEGLVDTNNDFIPDAFTVDDDSDGIPTLLEDTNGNGDWFDDDWDTDGIPDFRDPDLPSASDQDGDGYAFPGDCDDGDPTVFPNAPELCDEVDNNCDGQVDEDFFTPDAAWYEDVDQDGYGDVLTEVYLDTCSNPGFTTQAGDCDDTDPGVNPGAIEVCDGTDNDCDGDVDVDAEGPLTPYFTDADGDGYGDPTSETLVSCLPAGAVLTGQDCDDTDPDAYPTADEVCDDGIDQDCDGQETACVGTAGGCVTSGVGGSYAVLLLPPLWLGGRRRRSR